MDSLGLGAEHPQPPANAPSNERALVRGSFLPAVYDQNLSLRLRQSTRFLRSCYLEMVVLDGKMEDCVASVRIMAQCLTYAVLGRYPMLSSSFAEHVE